MMGFRKGERVKWADPENDSEMMYGKVAGWGGAKPGCTSVIVYDSDPLGSWLAYIPTVDLHHADEPAEDCSGGYFTGDFGCDPTVVPPENKGYEPDGFNREAFDDFMRNL